MTSCELVDGIYRKVPIENASSICMLFGRVEVIAGINLPMLIRLESARRRMKDRLEC